MDLKNAFLHGDLKEEYDPSLFLQRTPKGIVGLLVYVDDIVVTGFDQKTISKLKKMLHSTFHMKELGHLTYFLGLELVGLTNSTLVDSLEVNVKYRREESDILDDPTQYYKLVSSLIYVTITRLDISFVVHTISKFMQFSRHFHFSAIQRIIRYLLGSLTDTDWATIQTQGNLMLAGKQDLVLKSSIKAKYCTMSIACSEIIWLCCLLIKLGFLQAQPTSLHANNTNAFTMNERNTLKLIVTRFKKHMIVESSTYHMSQHLFKQLIFSLKFWHVGDTIFYLTN
ncbi:putative mitochondrial protein, partial [Mucuna pruriens]